MRYMIMHKTSAYWEAGAKPTPELAQRVGAMVGEIIAAGVLKAGDGLAPSSQGARVRVAGGKATVSPGPIDGKGALPARYVSFRAESVDQAADVAGRFGRIFGDVAVDVRPANEPWDIGFGEKPAGLTTRRYMAVVNADASSSCGAPTAAQKAAANALRDELEAKGRFLGMEYFEPDAKGKRLRVSPGSKVAVLDGPFTETKELIGGFVTVEVPSIDEAVKWAMKYVEAVDVEEVDVRGLIDG